MEETDGRSGQRRTSPVVLIPAYDPDARLLPLLKALGEVFARIVLVDDGSVRGREILSAASPLVERVLVHAANRGKGAALKTGLAYIGAEDVVTADADGQHTIADIVRVADALSECRGGLVLGERALAGDVPLRSRFGNAFTRLVFRLAGVRVTDTQTGLRGIPGSLVERVAAIPGDRYEYELLMLLDTRRHAERPCTVPIETVYFDGNKGSHFRPFGDSVRNNWALFRGLVNMV